MLALRELRCHYRDLWYMVAKKKIFFPCKIFGNNWIHNLSISDSIMSSLQHNM